MPRPPVNIALAIAIRDRRVLVARRRDDVHLGGLWEFPGGKMRANEDAITAALRELSEECGVKANECTELPSVEHAYTDRTVRMTAVACRWQAGEARAIESAEVRWVSADELRELPMPPANAQLLFDVTALLEAD